MLERIENIILGDAISKAELAALEEACASDDTLSAEIRLWAALRARVGEAFQAELPESRVLVLFALSEADASGELTPEERALADSIRDRIQASPSGDTIRVILDRIREEARSFDAAWEEATVPETAPVHKRTRFDRAPIRRIFAPAPLVRWGYALAAVLAVAVITVVLLREQVSTPETWTYSALAGQTHIVNLPDGSSVRLVDGARLSHRVDGASFDRQVTLEGRAFFDVEKGDTRFVVQTANARISVFGTSFGVDSNPGQRITEVVLVSGSVRLESSGPASGPVFLQPGQFSRVIGDDAPLEPSDVDVGRALSWTDLFIFRSTRLDEAMQRLSDSYEVEIVVDDAVADRTVTGTFTREQGLDSILDAVASALNVQVESIGDTGGFRISK